MQQYKGQGTIYHIGKQILSGAYNITKESHPDRHPVQSGIFEVSGANLKEIMDFIQLLSSMPDLTLAIQGGRRFNITLTLIKDTFDPSRGYARFSITFMPGEVEI